MYSLQLLSSRYPLVWWRKARYVICSDTGLSLIFVDNGGIRQKRRWSVLRSQSTMGTSASPNESDSSGQLASLAAVSTTRSVSAVSHRRSFAQPAEQLSWRSCCQWQRGAVAPSFRASEQTEVMNSSETVPTVCAEVR